MFQNPNSLPSSLPKNWPNSTAEDILQCPERRIQIGTPQQYQFELNFVKTSKYEIWNFLPLFLMETFDPRNKIANCYFLVIVIFQMIPSISNTHGVPTTLFPLSVVIAVDAIFQILEDINRHKADIESNSSLTQRFNSNTNQFDIVPWSQVNVGDILKVEIRKNIPADIVILSVSEKNHILPTGICYVETKSLDGETNLKLRNALHITYNKVTDTPASLRQLKGTVRMEHPNKMIDSFTGVIEFNNITSISNHNSNNSNSIASSNCNNKCAIQPQNILLRGCVLRNTDWIIGVVLNTGHDTKIMMSSTITKPKHSQLEYQAGLQILRIILLLLFICFVGAIGQTIWNDLNNVQYLPYLQWNVDPGGNFVTSFFYFFLLHATFIPVSLYVSMSIARYCQRFFMNNDLDMYYAVLDTPASVRTMTLNEELGQITHVFSDKTGTLTRNVMDFRKMSINGIKYGQGITEIGKSAWKLQGKEIPFEVMRGEACAQKNAVPHVSFYDPLFDTHMSTTATTAFTNTSGTSSDSYLNNNSSHTSNNNASNNSNSNAVQKQKIQEFFLTLALCHDVIPERNDVTGKITFSAPNPDDHALVCAAEYFGYAFKDRQDKHVIVTQLREKSGVGIAGGGRKSGATSRVNSKVDLATNATNNNNNNNTTTSTTNDEDLTFEILDVIEFTSKRKRMSVIIKDEINDYAVLYCKGADSAILPRLQRNNNNSNNNNNNTRNSASFNSSTSFNNSSSNFDSTLSPPNKNTAAPSSSSSSSSFMNDTHQQQHQHHQYQQQQQQLDQELLIQKTENDIREFAIEGLRVLLIAKAIIPLTKYHQWKLQYTEAKTNITEIEKCKHGESNLIETLEDQIENQLILLGATAIEDRLQDGVSECISELILAGIKIWVLTGDKEETAINVALACNVLQPKEFTEHILMNKTTCPTASSLLTLLDTELKKLEIANHHHALKPRSLIIDGPCLLDVMRYNHHTTSDIDSDNTFSHSQLSLSSRHLSPSTDNNNTTSNNTNTHDSSLSAATADEENIAINNTISSSSSANVHISRSNNNKNNSNSNLGSIYTKFLKLTSSCKAVVCCRMSPDQKREIVHMVKKDVPYARTLGIGDGANDVAMIQEAHVGVGIKGEEGVQAVNASDFAIAQFKYLSILLLKHGRYNYIRLANLICYMFYKNVLMSMAQFWLNFHTGFSGQKYYFEIGIQMFNVLFTSFPILALAIFDMDVLPSSIVKFPQLYQDTVNSLSFNNKVFGLWILTAIGESLIVAFLPLLFLRNYSSNTTGSSNNNNNITASSSSFWEAGVLCFTAIVFIVNIKIFFIQTRWNCYMLILVAISVLLWFAVAFTISASINLPFDYDTFMIVQHVMSSGTFWLSLLLLVGMIYAKDVWVYGIERNFNYRPNHIIAEMEVYGEHDSSLHHATIDSSSTSNTTVNGSPFGHYFSSLTTPFLNKNKSSSGTATIAHRPRTASESSIDFLIDKQTGQFIANNNNNMNTTHNSTIMNNMNIHHHIQPIHLKPHSSSSNNITGTNSINHHSVVAVDTDVVASPLHESHITMSSVNRE